MVRRRRPTGEPVTSLIGSSGSGLPFSSSRLIVRIGSVPSAGKARGWSRGSIDIPVDSYHA